MRTIWVVYKGFGKVNKEIKIPCFMNYFCPYVGVCTIYGEHGGTNLTIVSKQVGESRVSEYECRAFEAYKEDKCLKDAECSHIAQMSALDGLRYSQLMDTIGELVKDRE